MNNKSSRSNLAFRNSIVSGLVTLLNFPIQFINRYFMVHYLGATYLGLTSLFTNILSVLSLADLGIGTAIVFLMYKPLADHDYDKVSLIMHYYRKIYQAIALVIFTGCLLFICWVQRVHTSFLIINPCFMPTSKTELCHGLTF